MGSITEHLATIQCGCERADVLRGAGMDRDALVRELHKLGFGRPNQAIPTDWATYYHEEELRDFILEYANHFTPAA